MTTGNIYREVTLKEITEGDIGRELKVAGWVENIRDHGGVSFVDLRDMYGVLQVVMRDTSLLNGLSKEMCIAIEGLIEKRDEETYNPKIPTGTIELEAHKVEVLGKVYKQLPFEVMTSKETREDVRLKYRYLDLRNKKVKDNIIFRSQVISFLREKMTELGFLEIQTPILCASSPEGAREFGFLRQESTPLHRIYAGHLRGNRHRESAHGPARNRNRCRSPLCGYCLWHSGPQALPGMRQPYSRNRDAT